MSEPTSNSAATSTDQFLAASAAPKIVLEGRGLGKIYGAGARSINVFQQVNLQLRQGEMVAIVAPSGAGKSTLLHLLATLDTPTSGAIYFESKHIETNNEAALSNFRNCAVGFATSQESFLVGNSSAWRLPGPSSPGRACCWQMNLPETWTSGMLGPYSSYWNGCTGRTG